MNTKIICALTLMLLFFCGRSSANFLTSNFTNYTTFLSGLLPGDTLLLTAGTYTNQLNLNNLNGTASNPIVIMGEGNSTLFLGNACCNTVNISNCSYLV